MYAYQDCTGAHPRVLVYYLVSSNGVKLQDLLYCPDLKRSIPGVLKQIYFIGVYQRKDAVL